MNQRIEIDVIDKDGWKKTFPVEKNIFHIGSIAANEIVLEAKHGAGVSPRHAQLIALQEGGFRLVNLGDNDIHIGGHGDDVVAPRSVAAVTDGSVLTIGDFTLTFHGETATASGMVVAKREGNIGLQLHFAETQLAPNQSRGGILIVSNQGDKTGVQFELELEGLDDDCFTLEPAPLLSAGSEAEVAFRFYHRGHKPLAGERPVTIRATAPKAYPNDVAIATCTLDVQPYFWHTFGPATGAALVPELPGPDDEFAPIEPESDQLFETIDAGEEAVDTSWAEVEAATSEPVEETPPALDDVVRQQEPPAEIDEADTQMCVPLEDARVLTAADAAKALPPDTLVMVIEAAPAAPAPPVETAAENDIEPAIANDDSEPEVTEPETTTDDDWWPEPAVEAEGTPEPGSGTEPGFGDEEPAVIVLKAAPSPDVEAPVEAEPVADTDDWWSETEPATES